VVLPIYAASEPKITGISARALCEGIKAHGHKEVHYARDFDAAVSHLKQILKPGDIVLSLGAGDVWKVGMKILNEVTFV
jgi:UDP-N-acetylmuramate--alanine ligase